MFKSPQEIIVYFTKSGIKKSEISTKKLLILSFLAGTYIAFGALLAIKIGGGIQTDPGIKSFIFGAVFPIGLMFTIIAGAELFTGNVAILIPSLFTKKISLKSVLRNWSLSYLGNFVGSVFIAYFFVYLTELFTESPWLEVCQNIAINKVDQEFHILFLKAIACNWLVCLAVWLATASKQISGKIMGIWFPIMAFVALGFEHSIANMFFIPLGMLYGADISWIDFLRNIVPVTIGNIIGGAFFVGLIYSIVYTDKKTI